MEKATGNQTNERNYRTRCWLLDDGYSFSRHTNTCTRIWFLSTSAVRIVNDVFAVFELVKRFLIYRAVMLIAMFTTARHW